MSVRLLTETHCARLLVAILATDFGFEIENHRTHAQRDELNRKMLIKAEVSGSMFEACLSLEDLEPHSDHARGLLAEQLQPQVFAMWSQSSPQTVESQPAH